MLCISSIRKALVRFHWRVSSSLLRRPLSVSLVRDIVSEAT